MPNPSQLPYLLQLIDDDSETVRKAVTKELSAYGSSLEAELEKLSIPLNIKTKRFIRSLFEEEHRTWLQEIWPSWFGIENDKEKLEMALSFLAEFQNARKGEASLSLMLDKLTEQYNATFQDKDALLLSHFLFELRELKGTEANYYHPKHSNLLYVLQNKKGIPISLACIYILVGHRLGLNIEGCNFPGHFLARATSKDKVFLIDCFNDGQILEEDNIIAIDEESSQILQEILHTPTNAQAIIRRILRNLSHAYHYIGQQKNSNFMLTLLEET